MGTNVDTNLSTGNSSHRTLARSETLGFHIGTRQNILPDFMYVVRAQQETRVGVHIRSLVILSLAVHAHWQSRHHVDRRLSLIKFLTSTTDGCIAQSQHAPQMSIDL